MGSILGGGWMGGRSIVGLSNGKSLGTLVRPNKPPYSLIGRSSLIRSCDHASYDNFRVCLEGVLLGSIIMRLQTGNPKNAV